MSMDIRKIKKLIEMLQESDLTEIEVTEGEEAVRISRKSSNDIVVEKPTSEAMKMMNEIKSEFSGKIVSIEVEDGEPVQFSQDLITLE